MNDIITSEILNTLSAVVFGVSIIASVAWIIVTAIIAIKQRANTRTRAKIYDRLIDKFGTVAEFIEFLQSDAGLKFIEENTIETSLPLMKIVGATQKGIILALLGTGLLVTGNIFGESLGGDLYIVLTVGGVIGLTVGIGFLISSLVSFRLCKAWGFVPERANGTTPTNPK